MSTQLSTETLDINSFQELLLFAEKISKSSMIPKEYMGRPDNIMVAVMMGRELGLKPFQAMQSIATINGKPSVYGDAALALVMARRDFEDIQEDDFATIKINKKATCVISRKGRTPVIRSFDHEDARKANLLGKAGPWTQYESRMFQMRARAFALRDSFADVLKGISIAEEAQDMPEEKDITPTNINPVKSKIEQLLEQKKAAPSMPIKINLPEENKKDDSDLSIVINLIDAAQSIESLRETKKYAKILTDENELSKVRTAYNDKLKKINEKSPVNRPVNETENNNEVDPNDPFVQGLGSVE
jgi:hypothetical protein